MRRLRSYDKGSGKRQPLGNASMKRANRVHVGYDLYPFEPLRVHSANDAGKLFVKHCLAAVAGARLANSRYCDAPTAFGTIINSFPIPSVLCRKHYNQLQPITTNYNQLQSGCN